MCTYIYCIFTILFTSVCKSDLNLHYIYDIVKACSLRPALPHLIKIYSGLVKCDIYYVGPREVLNPGFTTFTLIRRCIWTTFTIIIIYTHVNPKFHPVLCTVMTTMAITSTFPSQPYRNKSFQCMLLKV